VCCDVFTDCLSTTLVCLAELVERDERALPLDKLYVGVPMQSVLADCRMLTPISIRLRQGGPRSKIHAP